MVWFNVDDTLPMHERVIRAGNAAMGLWVRAGAWSAGQLTDGFVPREVARTLGSSAEIRKLVQVGLWHEVDGGYRFHAWAHDGTGQKRQPTKAEVEERRRIERERKASARAAARARDTATTPGTVPQGVPVGHRPDTRPESRGVSALPSHTKPYLEEKRAPIGALSIDEPAEAGPSIPSSTDLAIVTEHPRRSSYPARFEEFWQAYPRHEGKRAALAAWARAITRAQSAEQIIDGARRYAADPNREPAYTAHPTTWLNRDGWHDAPLPSRQAPDRLQQGVEQMWHDLGAQGVIR